MYVCTRYVCMYVLALKMASIADTALNRRSLTESMANFVYKFKKSENIKNVLTLKGQQNSKTTFMNIITKYTGYKYPV